MEIGRKYRVSERMVSGFFCLNLWYDYTNLNNGSIAFDLWRPFDNFHLYHHRSYFTHKV
jgi:hypothetical protein